jgi:hypothetical protein
MLMEPTDLDSSQKAVLLALANVPETHRRERLYFEKLLFLLTKTVRDELPDLDQSFEAYKFGMYSEYADEIIQRFETLGLTEEYDIRPAGKTLAVEVSKDPGSKLLVEGLSRVLKFVAGLDTPDLLYAAYRLYPELTTESEIAGRVRSSRLEHFSIAPNAIKDGETTTAFSDKGNPVKVTRRGRQLMIELPTP